VRNFPRILAQVSGKMSGRRRAGEKLSKKKAADFSVGGLFI
jgi:hypothetical protein